MAEPLEPTNERASDSALMNAIEEISPEFDVIDTALQHVERDDQQRVCNRNHGALASPSCCQPPVEGDQVVVLLS